MSKDKDYAEYCLKAGIENRNCSTDTTHYEGCYDSGPKHYECALLEVKKLQREWVGLTNDEKAYSNRNYAGKCAEAWQGGVEWAEAKLKEKNT